MDVNSMGMLIYAGVAAAGYVVAWLQHRQPSTPNPPAVPVLPGVTPAPDSLTIGHGLILKLIANALSSLPAAPSVPAAPVPAGQPDLSQFLALAMALLQAKPAPAPTVTVTVPNAPTSPQ
jgi:hypothetical protein